MDDREYPQLEDTELVAYNPVVQKELTPFEYRTEKTNDSIKIAGLTAIIVVSYMFCTLMIGQVVDFGYIWWGISLSYIVTIGFGITYSVLKFATSEDLINKYEEDYKSKQK